MGRTGVSKPVLCSRGSEAVGAGRVIQAVHNCSLRDYSSAPTFFSHHNPPGYISGHICTFGENMAEGGALSFIQAKALVLKQRLSPAEVQALESAQQTIFTEFDKEVLFFLIFVQSFSVFPFFKFSSFSFIEFCYRAMV